jgi:DNA-binding response OmpR family regulator
VARRHLHRLDRLTAVPSGKRRPEGRVLVVEDDPTLRDSLALALEGHGYTVERRPDASAIGDTVAAARPDVIILDVMLPGLDGLSACRLLRSQGVETPILMLTARTADIDKIVGLEAGADDYVTKPFSIGELVARIRALMRRAPGGRSRVMQSGNLALDLDARRATLDDAEIRLAHREFDLLAELMRNPGVALSRDLLLEKIWGYDFIGDSRTVDVHIRWLREKIEADPSSPVRITTVRGVGYRFEP